MIRININDPSYKALRIYSHELDRYHYINVAFFDNGDNVELSGLTVKASITCDGFVVAEDVDCSYITESGVDGVRLNIATNENFTILSGKMKIEFSIKNGDVIVHPVAPLVVDIMPSILDNAQVTPESLGTFSEIAQEVAEARGEFNTLDERLDTLGTIPDGSITTAKLADKAVTAEKIDNLAVDTNQIASGAVKSSKIALEAINPDHLSAETLALFNSKLNWQGFTTSLIFRSKSAFDDYEFEVGKVYSIYLSSNVLYTGSDGLSALLIMPTTSVRMLISYTKGIYYSSYSNDVWSEFKPQTTVVNLGDVSSRTDFDSAAYCTELAEFLFAPQGSVVTLFETSLPCKLTYNNGYQCVERIGSALKFTRKINSIAPDFSADEWVKQTVGWGNLDTSVQARITNDEARITNLEENKLSFEKVQYNGAPVTLSQLNSRGWTFGTFYYLHKGTDVIPEVSTVDWVVFFPLTNTTQFLIMPNGVIYSRERESTAAQWSDFTRTTAALESEIGTLNYKSEQMRVSLLSALDRITDLESTVGTLNASLETTLDGGAE